MKAVVWHGTEDVRVDDVPEPSLREPTDAIVRITSTAICGSDLHLYRVLSMYMEERDILGHVPNYCDVCEVFVRTHPGGAEVEISMLFADVRGSTALAEHMRPIEFSRLMNRFYDCANRVVIDSDGIVDKLVGDEVVALYVPAVGPDHARKAVEAARDLLRATAELLPVGAGVHTGIAYVGAVGSDSTVADFTALGDAVNVAARLASVADGGEALISESAYAAAGVDLGELERRELELKGRGAPLAVRLLRV